MFDPAAIPAPVATGLISERPLAHLLSFVVERALTGTIELADDPREYALIAVAEGSVTRLWTSEPVMYLGHVLYESGLLDDAELGSSLAEIAATKSLHGQLLLAKGIIDAAQLANGLRQQRLRKLHHLFELPKSARFAFYADVDLVGERPNDVEPLDPLASIWRGVVAHPSAEHVRAMITAVGPRAIRVTGALETRTFDETERSAIESLRTRPETLAELAGRPGIDARIAELLVYFLLITKRGEVPEPVARPTPVFDGAPASVRAPSTQGPGEALRRISVPEANMTPPPGSIRVPVRPVAKLSVSFTGSEAADGVPPSSVRGVPLSTRTSGPPSSRVVPIVADDGPPSSLRGVPPAPRSSPAVARTTRAPAPPAPTVRSPEADSALAQAEMHFVLEERQEAVSFVRQALTHSPKMPAALVLLSAIEASAVGSGDEPKLREILKRFDSLIALDSTCRRALFYRARIRKRLGNLEGAIQDLRQAVVNDPDDVDVQRELRLCERQEKEPAPPKSTSFLDRLRGKSG